jgi:hypothetical protein
VSCRSADPRPSPRPPRWPPCRSRGCRKGTPEALQPGR